MWDCVWLCFSICGAGHESELHENINTSDQKKKKKASISRLRAGLREFFQGGSYAHVGNARYGCDEARQSRRNQKSPLQEKVTCAKKHTK